MKAFVLARAKRRNTASAYLTDALNQAGVDAYRVTPNYIPARRVEDAEVIFNHGTSALPAWIERVQPSTIWFNSPLSVMTSANKHLMTRVWEEDGIPHLESTHSKFQAGSWLDAGIGVVVRGTTTGCAGRGISILTHSSQEIPDAPMYTKLFSGYKVREYRVFIAGDKACEIVEKRRRGRDWCEVHGVDRDSVESTLIRTWHNGWVFARNTMDASEDEREVIKRAAERAAKSIGVRMGGVDMIVNRCSVTGELNEIAAVETNTSIGLDSDSTSTRIFARALVQAAEAGR